MDTIAKGKRMLWVVFGLIIVMEVFSLIEAIVTGDSLVQTIIRDLLTILLCYFVYQGYVWAKWVMFALMALAAVMDAILIPVIFILIGVVPGFEIFLLMLMALVSLGTTLASAILLLASKSLNAFLQSQKQKRQQTRVPE